MDANTLRSVLNYNQDTGVFTWKVRPSARTFAGDTAGNITSGGYWEIKFRKKSHLAHRLAWLYVHGAWPLETIDHINGDRLDNRLANLRDVTIGKNGQNKYRAKRTNGTGFLGVRTTDKRKNGFRAVIKFDGKTKNLGSFDTPEKAHEAYMAAKAKYHISQNPEVTNVLGA